MQLTLSRSSLVRLLSRVTRAAARGGNMPILSHVLLTAAADTLFATATDLCVRLESFESAQVSRCGAVTLPAADFERIAKALPEGPVSISVDDSYRATLAVGRVKYTLKGLSPDDYPKASDAEGTPVTLPASVLAGLLSRTLAAASKDETRYHLCGIYLHPGGAATTDGHRLHTASGATGLASGVILPARAAKLLLSDLADASGDVTLSLSRSELRAQIGEVSFSVKLIDAQFPDYQQVIPKQQDHRIPVPRGPLSEALGRLALVCDRDRHQAVVLQFSAGWLRLSVDNPDVGEANEEIQLEGGPAERLTVGLNPAYAREALACFDAKAVTVGLRDELSPVVFEAEGEGARVVIMPVRL